MAKLLVSKSEFARLAGVNPSTITKVCKASLNRALVGNRIDRNHPDAIAYLERLTDPNAGAPATGIDPLYEQAVELYRGHGCHTANSLREPLKIGSKRATQLIALIKAAGIVREVIATEPPPEPEPVATPPKLRGNAARNQTRKDAALARHAADPDPDGYEVPENLQAFVDMTLGEIIRRFGTDVAFLDWLKSVKMIEDVVEKRLKNAQLEGSLVSRRLVETGVIDQVDSAHRRLMTDGAKSLAGGLASKAAAGASLDEMEAYAADLVSQFIRPLKGRITRALRNA